MNAADDTAQSDRSAAHLLDVASETMAKVKNCWLITVARSGEVSARVVEPFSGSPDDREWTVWVLTSRGSRKIDEIHYDDRVSLGYQYDPESAHVTLVGRATVIDDRAALAARWKPSWNNIFPDGADYTDAVFLKVEVNRIQLFNVARKITPAPFYKRSAALARSASGQWDVI